MKIIRFVLLITVIFVSSISSGFSQSASDLAQSENQFAFDLYARLSKDEGNVFFSPYSLTNALMMTYEGARGQTARQMRAVLHLGHDDASRRTEVADAIEDINGTGRSYELSVANALWAQKDCPFKDDYLNLVKNTYSTEAHNLDFKSDPEASRVAINDWVSDKTHERIKDLLPAGSITPNSRLVLTNAVFFKGKWATPFMEEETLPDFFWLDKDRSIKTDIMILRGKSFWYMDNDQVQVLQLPYKTDDLSMLVILPRANDIHGLEKIFTLGALTQWQQSMTMQEVNIVLPKFKFNSSYPLNDTLIAMGMKLAFDEHLADFSGMADIAPNDALCIGLVIHEAWINTDEEGTEASAATGVVMKRLGMQINRPIVKIFRADHPFLLVIQENKTGHILFMGRVADPR